MSASVLRAGFFTSVQDLGRTGLREFGISPGGALDPHALRVANLLAGNDESTAGLEVTVGGLRVTFFGERLIAWCGGEFDVRIDSTRLPAGHAAWVGSGEEVTFDSSKNGCRAWLAISGGVDVPVVLGSRATDLRANFGGLDGRLLRDADILPLGRPPRAVNTTAEKISSWSAPTPWSQTANADPVLRFVRGSAWDLFDAPAQQRFARDAFAVLPDSDRMGARLDGPELKRNDDVDLVSEAVAPGTIQVPPSGQPIVLLGDCQTIGGYPKIAHVIAVDLPVAAQLRAGDRIRFREVSLADACALLLERERELEQFRAGIKMKFE